MPETREPTLAPPLCGIRVLDISSTLPGPYCTQLLADLGADIIKVERPGGDSLRDLMPATFALYNRGKRSITLNLKESDDYDRFDKLMVDADVLVVGFRPSVNHRLAVGSDIFLSRNPRGIHCAISGFGATGSYRERAGHDLNYVGLAGGLVGPADGVIVDDPPLLVSDLASGALAALAIMAALRRRDVSGVGCAIDLSMADVVLTWAAAREVDGLVRQGSETSECAEPDFASVTNPALAPGQGVFLTADAQPVTLGLIEDHFWHQFAEHVPDARCRAEMQDARFATNSLRCSDYRTARDALRQAVSSAKLAYWTAAARDFDLPIYPIQNFNTAVTSAPFSERQVVSLQQDHIAATFPALFDGEHASAGNAIPARGRTEELTWR